MKRVDVTRLEGRDLDVTVGYHIMDLVAPPWVYPLYSTDLFQSHQVVEKMKSKGWTFRLVAFPAGGYSAWFEKHLQRIQSPNKELFDQIHNAEAETEPLAICKAALIAIVESENR